MIPGEHTPVPHGEAPTLSLGTLALRLDGFDPARASVIAGLVPGELAGHLDAMSTSDLTGHHHRHRLATPPVKCHPGDSDAVIAARIAATVAETLRAGEEGMP